MKAGAKSMNDDDRITSASALSAIPCAPLLTGGSQNSMTLVSSTYTMDGIDSRGNTLNVI
jgi:hypothetical protein